jgi:hypothetical protein
MAMNDRELLARTLQAEAGNQGYEGMLDVGSVIYNRVYSGRFGGDNLKNVIMKPGQFSAWNSVTGYAGGEQGQDMDKMSPSEEAYKAADRLMSGKYEDKTGGATHYYNPEISQPEWGKGEGWVKRGEHVFGTADNRTAGERPTPPEMSSKGTPPAVEEGSTTQAMVDEETGEVPSMVTGLLKSYMQTPVRRSQPPPPPMRRVPFQPISLVKQRK